MAPLNVRYYYLWDYYSFIYMCSLGGAHFAWYLSDVCPHCAE